MASSCKTANILEGLANVGISPLIQSLSGISFYSVLLTQFPPGQNGHRFADDIFWCIFVNEKFCILIEISLKFVPKGPTDNNLEFVQIMAWRRISDKPLSEPMLSQFIDAYVRHQGEMSK